MVNFKICNKCNIEKEISEFSPNGSGRFRARCKKCERERHRNCAKLHSERRKIYNKKYRENNKKKISSQRMEYRKRNKDDIAKYNKEYSQNHIDEKKEYMKQYRILNEEKIKIGNAVYRQTPAGRASAVNAHVKRRGVVNLFDPISKNDWVKIMKANDWRCIYCDVPLTIENRTSDHLCAINNGGKHRESNLVPCCRSCNSSKQDKYLSEWEVFLDLSLQKRTYLLQKESAERQ